MASGMIKNTLSVSTAEVNLTLKNTSAKLYKQGDIVWFTSLEDFTSLPNGRTVIGTVPVGFRPNKMLRIPISNRASDYSQYYFATISYNGEISVEWGGSAKTSAFNGTFQTTYFSDH